MPSRYHDGPPSDHFDGTVFFNPGRPQLNGLADLLKWQLGGGRARWPWHAPAGVTTPAVRVDGARLVVTHVGHATQLIQTRGLNILIDPVWSAVASPVPFAGPRRVNAPGIPFDALPALDAVLISHNHYDHMDMPTVRRLVAARAPLFIVPLGNDRIIRRAVPAARVEAYDWGQSRALSPDVSLHLLQAHHWSARGMGDRCHALWAAFVIETPDGGIYVAGDTGYGAGDHFRAARARFPRLRAAILPIGAYEPRWFMAYSHMNPAEAVAALGDLGAGFAIACHWGTFQLTNEAIDDPPIALAAALAEAGLPPARFLAPRPGDVVEVP